MPRNEKQTGRSQNAPLDRAGSELHGSDQKKIYVLTDAEYEYYTELIQGYFEKLTRWWNIAKAFEKALPRDPGREYPPDYESYDSGFIVVQTPDGLAISPEPPSLTMFPKNPDLVLHTWAPRARESNISENHFTSHITLQPGLAGENLLIDAENARIIWAEITINQFIPRGESSLSRSLSIDTQLTDDTVSRRTGLDYRECPGKSLSVTYQFKNSMLHILRGGDDRYGPDPMSDVYATHLFTEINKLIPASLTLQTKLETSQETLPALPLPTRRPAG